MVTNPICSRFFLLFRTIGTILMCTSLACDFVYLYKKTFSSKLWIAIYCGLLGLRLILVPIIFLRYACVKLCGTGSVFKTTEDPDSKTYKQNLARFKSNGCLLYSVLPLTFFFGSFRLLNFRNFASEIAVGLALDLFTNILPLILIQGLNNATLRLELLNQGGVF